MTSGDLLPVWAQLARERREPLPAPLHGLLTGVAMTDAPIGTPGACPECGLLPVNEFGWVPGEYLTHLREDHGEAATP